MADLLRSDRDLAPSFLNSVLNQLNWAFSEFIGMIQEIQQAAERLERNFVDSRQLKVCATCFDLSVSLLRVLEMTVTLAPEIFLDWNRPSSELLLRRLAQLLNQVLNRVTAERNLFDRVVNLRLPGLESVDHYPILVAVTGILVRLLVDTDVQGLFQIELMEQCWPELVSGSWRERVAGEGLRPRDCLMNCFDSSDCLPVLIGSAVWCGILSEHREHVKSSSRTFLDKGTEIP
ncbi:hypothetical protein TURU_016708 [Turdus rufiventris]|nr:hypothetical protein TURU_016708 [Turdus rufiventris]